MKQSTIPIYGLESFKSNNRTEESFQVEIFDANRHFKVKYPHRHDFFEVLFIERGSGIHTIDGHDYKITPPTIFFMSPGQAHKLECSSDIEGYIFLFTGEFFLLNKSNRDSLIEFPFFFTINSVSPPLQFPSIEDSLFMRGLFQRAVSDVAVSNRLARAILEAILVESTTYYPKEQMSSEHDKGAIMVKQLYQLIEDNYLKNLSVNEYAQQLNITAGHLTQIVKRVTGRRTTDIIKAKQIIESKRLLIYTTLSITEIADRLNFIDQSYFSKFFRREVGVSPSQFRNSSEQTTEQN